jgi:hypothetical protein
MEMLLGSKLSLGETIFVRSVMHLRNAAMQYEGW